MSKPGRRKPRMVMTRGRRLLATVITGVVAVAGIGLWIVYGTSAFAVESVAVRGATFTDKEQVRDTAAIASGTAIASVDTGAIAKKVSAIASVERVTVDRDWPGGIIITITERSARLAVPKGKKFTLVDESGVAFRTVRHQPPKTVKTTVANPGSGDAATTSVLKVLPKLTKQLENDLISVEAKTPSRIELELDDSRTVFWGDASDSARKAEVATALLGRSEKHLDVSAPDVPTVS